MRRNLMALALTASFAAAAPAAADEWKTAVTSSDVTDPEAEHFMKFYGGTVHRSCDLMSGGFNPDGTAIEGVLSISKADLRRLTHILPDDVQAKSYDEQTAWLNALKANSPDEYARILEKFQESQKQAGFYPAIKRAFDSTFPATADELDQRKLRDGLPAKMKTLADNIQRETGLSISIAVTITDSCGKPPAPQG